VRRVIGLPGTHSKWVTVEAGRIVGFRTFMTGEVYDLLCRHSLLGRTQRQPPAPDLAAFDRGVGVTLSAEARAGVLSNIFSARSLGLVGALRDTEQGDYLSGLLVGHELGALEQLSGSDLANGVVLAGSEPLCERYRRALSARGCRAEVAEHATERGLWALAAWAGLVEDGRLS
jgi:2-dehydro-3-deoxygalactonokinase